MKSGIQYPGTGKNVPVFGEGPACSNSHRNHISTRKEELLVRIAVQIVAMSNGICPDEITGPFRGTADVSRARQITCYLLHTSLSMPLVNIAKYFQKDRTTIGHACRLVEDWRDEPAFDDELLELEQTAKLLRKLAMEDLGENIYE